MKRMGSFLCAFLLITLPLAAGENKKEQDRLENCGYVIKDILDIPDNIPQDLLDKAECVIIYPSVMKAAFIVSANYGRGAMTCRTGEHFTGPWSAPTMMALEGGSVGPEQRRVRRAVEVLEKIGSPVARRVLEGMLEMKLDAALRASIKGSLQRLRP